MRVQMNQDRLYEIASDLAHKAKRGQPIPLIGTEGLPQSAVLFFGAVNRQLRRGIVAKALRKRKVRLAANLIHNGLKGVNRRITIPD